MGILIGAGPLVLLAVSSIGAIIRLICLAIALRGTSPRQRPAIILALSEFFRVLPRKRT